jgi:hypothetical protein
MLAFLLNGTAQAADPVPQLTLTIYNDDLVLIQDVRTLNVPAGRSRLEFQDVSATIHPETVSLAGNGLSVVEQNFDYDLLTPAKMMEKAVGKQVKVVRTNPGTGAQTTETATVLSVNGGVVLKIGNRIEVLRDDGIPARVVFDSIPENLRAHPTLSVTVDAVEAGSRQITLSYLASGISWTSNYVGMFDEKEGTLGLQGWITLSNRSGTTFKQADAELVAGAINTTVGGQNYRQYQARSEPSGQKPSNASQASVADYYVYRLPERTTVASDQTKQVNFLDLHSTGAAKTYQYDASDFLSLDRPAHASVAVRFSNGSEPLPAGTVRVYVRDKNGGPKFVGESSVGHTPSNSSLAVPIGDAFDVTVKPTVISSEKTKTGVRYAMSYTLRNARAEPVTLRLRQMGLNHDGAVESESLASERIDANTLGWTVPIPAQGETVLTFTVDTGT